MALSKQPVSPALAKHLEVLRELLTAEFGLAYAYQIRGGEHTLAAENFMQGTVRPQCKAPSSYIPALLAAAQGVYDAWEQDENGEDPELGTGGICDRIAEALGGVLAEHGYATAEGTPQGDEHANVVASADGISWLVDIPAHLYERGAGYNWRKLPGVKFRPENLSIEKL